MAQDAEKKSGLELPNVAKIKEFGRNWFSEHNLVACICIAALFFATIVGIFAFVAFSDFSGSAEFIYNQF